MILHKNLDRLILLCLKELYMNCIIPLDLSEMTFIEVIDKISNNTIKNYIRQSDYDTIYSKYISLENLSLKQQSTFIINISRYSPKLVANDFDISDNS